jgi:dihydrofolate synthase/folylpolyglutamate synthase
MTYSDAVQFLYGLRWFGTKLGLDHTRKLAELTGHPQNRLRFIHVAGTNGKGSTCAMLESIYRHAGFRVGLFTSPHLVSFCERIQVNRQALTEDEVIHLVQRLQKHLGFFQTADHPTFFEVVTVMALVYFAERQCDLVIWETGLGGRLDATNIVTPLAAVVTNVQLDHQAWLGDTLEQIAAEKAGIIKPGIPVVTATETPAALAVIEQTARSLEAPLRIVSRDDTSRSPLNSLELPLRGEHQRMNAALAIATVESLRDHLPVSSENVREGLLKVEWAGRLQVETTSRGQILVLDGAHNPAGAGTLRAAIRHYFPTAKPALILGMLRDKDWTTMCELLSPLSDRIILVPVASDRSTTPQELLVACQKAHPKASIQTAPSLTAALQATAADPMVIITGSLYLVGEAMETLQLSPQPHTDERQLNEWGSSAPDVKRR